MTVLSKKGIIKSLWVDLHCLAFIGLGEPACWELCFLVSGSSQVTRASRTAGSELISSTISLLSWQRLSFWSYLSTLGTNFAQIFRIFSSSRIILCTVPTLTSNYALIVSMDTRWSLSMKFFICPINSGVLTSLLVPHLSSSLTDSLPSLNLLCHSKTDNRFMQEGRKAVWSIPCVSVTFFTNLKQNIIAYHSFNVASGPDCIFEIHQLWQSGFNKVHSNFCCSCLFECEILKIGLSSHKMYGNNILKSLRQF